MYLDWQTIINIGSVLGALGIIFGLALKIHSWVIKQDNQTREIADLRKHHDSDVQKIKEENCLICFALSACLDGLQQLGANHTVPKAKEKLDKYLNQQAHE